MSITIAGNAGVVAEDEEVRNVQLYESVAGYPAAGGFYSVSGNTTAVVAAALAADVMLMSARLAVASARKAYIVRMRVNMWSVLGNAAAVDQGILALRKFTAVTPTGGNARTPFRNSATKGSASDITDIRDLNAALTGAPTFGADGIISQAPVPVQTGAIAAGYSSVMSYEWIMEFPAPVELAAGDGVALRTTKACPATCTWGYSYTLYWFER